MVTFGMHVEPVYGWLFGCCEHWLGEPESSIALSYLKADFLWWQKQRFGDVDAQIVLRDPASEEVCELWVIEQLLKKVTVKP